MSIQEKGFYIIYDILFHKDEKYEVQYLEPDVYNGFSKPRLDHKEVVENVHSHTFQLSRDAFFDQTQKCYDAFDLLANSKIEYFHGDDLFIYSINERKSALLERIHSFVVDISSRAERIKRDFNDIKNNLHVATEGLTAHYKVTGDKKWYKSEICYLDKDDGRFYGIRGVSSENITHLHIVTDDEILKRQRELSPNSLEFTLGEFKRMECLRIDIIDVSLLTISCTHHRSLEKFEITEKNGGVEIIRCDSNNIQHFKVPEHATMVDCSRNPLKTIDMGDNKLLERIYCDETEVKEITLPTTIKYVQGPNSLNINNLEEVKENNPDVSIDLTENTNTAT